MERSSEPTQKSRGPFLSGTSSCSSIIEGCLEAGGTGEARRQIPEIAGFGRYRRLSLGQMVWRARAMAGSRVVAADGKRSKFHPFRRALRRFLSGHYQAAFSVVCGGMGVGTQ